MLASPVMNLSRQLVCMVVRSVAFWVLISDSSVVKAMKGSMARELSAVLHTLMKDFCTSLYSSNWASALCMPTKVGCAYMLRAVEPS